MLVKMSFHIIYLFYYRYLSAEKFTHVYCSDLIRTKTTCRLILNENDDFKGKQDEVVYDQLLRERAFGEYDGMAVK